MTGYVATIITFLLLYYYIILFRALLDRSPTLYSTFLLAAPRGPKLTISPSKTKVGDTVRITVQGFQLGPSVVSFQHSGPLKGKTL